MSYFASQHTTFPVVLMIQFSQSTWGQTMLIVTSALLAKETINLHHGVGSSTKSFWVYSFLGHPSPE